MSADNKTIVECLRKGCVCSSEFGKCTRCYAADVIEALVVSEDRMRTALIDEQRLRGRMHLRAETAEAEVERLKGALLGVIDFIGSEEWRDAHTALEQIVNRIHKALEAKP